MTRKAGLQTSRKTHHALDISVVMPAYAMVLAITRAR